MGNGRDDSVMGVGTVAWIIAMALMLSFHTVPLLGKLRKCNKTK